MGKHETIGMDKPDGQTQKKDETQDGDGKWSTKSPETAAPLRGGRAWRLGLGLWGGVVEKSARKDRHMHQSMLTKHV